MTQIVARPLVEPCADLCSGVSLLRPALLVGLTSSTLAVQEQLLGTEHPTTIETRQELAHLVTLSN